MHQVELAAQAICEVAAAVSWAAVDAVCPSMSRGLRTSPRCTGSGCPDLASAALSTCRLRACADTGSRHFGSQFLQFCRLSIKPLQCNVEPYKQLRTVMYLGQLPAWQV